MAKAKDKAPSILQEFKAFISRGNVIDMAVGVFIGSAFTAIVNSLVNDVVMPVISVITGGVDFTAWKWVITPGTEEIAECAVRYGQFIQNIINFLLIAAIIYFVLVAPMNSMKEAAAKRKGVEAPASDNDLLVEIRDLLAGRPLTHPSDPQSPSSNL